MLTQRIRKDRKGADHKAAKEEKVTVETETEKEINETFYANG